MVSHICDICGIRYEDLARAEECESKGLINVHAPVGSVFGNKRSSFKSYLIIGPVIGHRTYKEYGFGSHFPYARAVGISTSDFSDLDITDIKYSRCLYEGVSVISKKLLREITQEEFNKILAHIKDCFGWMKKGNGWRAKDLKSRIEQYFGMNIRDIPIVRGRESSLDPRVQNNVLIFPTMRRKW